MSKDDAPTSVELEALKHSLEHRPLPKYTEDDVKSILALARKVQKENELNRKHIKGLLTTIDTQKTIIARLQSDRSTLHFPSDAKPRKRKRETNFLDDIIKAKQLEARDDSA